MAVDDEHVKGALVALDRAEAQTLKIRRGLRRRALRDQLKLGNGAELDDVQPETFRAYLWVPAWCWALVAMVAVVMSVPLPSVMVVAAALGAGVLAVGLRTVLTLQAAPRLFMPDAAELRALQTTLAEAGRHLQSVGSDPYRGVPAVWVGGDPTLAERPWTRLATIRRTAAAVRIRALPAAKSDTNGA